MQEKVQKTRTQEWNAAHALDGMRNSSWGNMRTRYDKLTNEFWDEFWAELEREKPKKPKTICE